MKNYFFYTVIILLCITNFSNVLFAQSANEKYKALNDYLATIIKDTTQVIFVAKEKINSNETLNTFGLNDIMIIDTAGNGRGDDTLYNKKDFEKMKTKYKNKCLTGKRIWCADDFWTKENLTYNKITFESMNSTEGIETIFKKYNDFDINIYGFSEPIYYQNKKYLIFTVNISGLNSSKTYLIVMKKSKEKWIVTHKGENPNIIN